jgi:hypothetical protein
MPARVRETRAVATRDCLDRRGDIGHPFAFPRRERGFDSRGITNQIKDRVAPVKSLRSAGVDCGASQRAWPRVREWRWGRRMAQTQEGSCQLPKGETVRGDPCEQPTAFGVRITAFETQ